MTLQRPRTSACRQTPLLRPMGLGLVFLSLALAPFQRPLSAPPRPEAPPATSATSRPKAASRPSQAASPAARTPEPQADDRQKKEDCQEFFETGDVASKERFFRGFAHPKGKPQNQGPAYRIGALELPSQGADCRFHANDLKASLLAFAKTNLSPSLRGFVAHLQREVLRLDFLQPISRERTDTEFPLERLKYALYALSLHDPLYDQKPGFGKPPKRVRACPNNQRSRYQFSLIPFRQHDLDRECKSLVDQGVALGFDRVTLFYPIPVSASFVRVFRCPPEAPKPCRPVYGKDYVFETLGTLRRPELHRCLDYLFQAGLTLNFVPHLESILTLNTTHEAETRVSLAVPHDAVHYYRAAYGDLFAFLRSKAKALSIRHLRIAAAAEMDPSFLTDPSTSLAMLQRLRRELHDLGLHAEITWNPFNNFRPMKRLDLQNLSCPTLERLLDSLDGIAPSLYEEYGNIPRQGMRTFAATRHKFFSELSRMFQALCPENSARLDAKSRRKTFLIGEFALQSGVLLYDAFHDQMRSESPNTDAVFWNTGSWNHLFGATSTDPLFPRFRSSILRTLQPCAPPTAPR